LIVIVFGMQNDALSAIDSTTIPTLINESYSIRQRCDAQSINSI